MVGLAVKFNVELVAVKSGWVGVGKNKDFLMLIVSLYELGFAGAS